MASNSCPALNLHEKRGNVVNGSYDLEAFDQNAVLNRESNKKRCVSFSQYRKTSRH